MDYQTMQKFSALSEFYKSGEIAVNDSTWSILQRPLSYNQRLLHTLHKLQIRIRPYNTGQDGFLLTQDEFEAAYPFQNMLAVTIRQRTLSDFAWWNWPAKAVSRSSYNTATRAFSVEAKRYYEDRVFQRYVVNLQSEGFITVLDYAENTHGFLGPVRAACRIFINKEALR